MPSMSPKSASKTRFRTKLIAGFVMLVLVIAVWWIGASRSIRVSLDDSINVRRSMGGDILSLVDTISVEASAELKGGSYAFGHGKEVVEVTFHPASTLRVKGILALTNANDRIEKSDDVMHFQVRPASAVASFSPAARIRVGNVATEVERLEFETSDEKQAATLTGQLLLAETLTRLIAKHVIGVVSPSTNSPTAVDSIRSIHVAHFNCHLIPGSSLEVAGQRLVFGDESRVALSDFAFSPGGDASGEAIVSGTLAKGTKLNLSGVEIEPEMASIQLAGKFSQAGGELKTAFGPEAKSSLAVTNLSLSAGSVKIVASDLLLNLDEATCTGSHNGMTVSAAFTLERLTPRELSFSSAGSSLKAAFDRRSVLELNNRQPVRLVVGQNTDHDGVGELSLKGRFPAIEFMADGKPLPLADAVVDLRISPNTKSVVGEVSTTIPGAVITDAVSKALGKAGTFSILDLKVKALNATAGNIKLDAKPRFGVAGRTDVVEVKLNMDRELTFQATGSSGRGRGLDIELRLSPRTITLDVNSREAAVSLTGRCKSKVELCPTTYRKRINLLIAKPLIVKPIIVDRFDVGMKVDLRVTMDSDGRHITIFPASWKHANENEHIKAKAVGDGPDVTVTIRPIDSRSASASFKIFEIPVTLKVQNPLFAPITKAMNRKIRIPLYADKN
jgi:hypothetical protein